MTTELSRIQFVNDFRDVVALQKRAETRRNHHNTAPMEQFVDHS